MRGCVALGLLRMLRLLRLLRLLRWLWLWLCWRWRWLLLLLWCAGRIALRVIHWRRRRDIQKDEVGQLVRKGDDGFGIGGGAREELEKIL